MQHNDSTELFGLCFYKNYKNNGPPDPPPKDPKSNLSRIIPDFLYYSDPIIVVFLSRFMVWGSSGTQGPPEDFLILRDDEFGQQILCHSFMN